VSEEPRSGLPDFVRAHPPVAAPWTHEYEGRRVALMNAALDNPAMLDLFASGCELPPGYGVSFDERVVEYPWLLADTPRGAVLDAGSTLNHAHILDRVLPQLDSLYITTLAPEAVAFPERGISYVFSDLRDLPFRDDLFDEVVSLSTLEHIGMDNTVYGIVEPRAENPEIEFGRALDELTRVLRPGGRLRISVPYGRQEDHGWFRQFGRADVDALLDGARASRADVTVYRYTQAGWQRSTLADAADAEYCDHTQDPKPSPADLAAAARAVACVELWP
jgi:SAM-dependent methyltransferase